jgi:hypothetical protein
MNPATFGRVCSVYAIEKPVIPQDVRITPGFVDDLLSTVGHEVFA